MIELTIPQIEEIAARAAKATPGPWIYQERQRGKRPRGRVLSMESLGRIEIVAFWDYGDSPVKPDAELCAAARTDIPALCSTALSAIRERDALKRGGCRCDTDYPEWLCLHCWKSRIGVGA